MMHNMTGGSAYIAGPRGAAVREAQHITHSSTSERLPTGLELSQIGRTITPPVPDPDHRTEPNPS
jgi:hypothetical protein